MSGAQLRAENYLDAWWRRLPVNAAVRTTLQGVVAVAVVAAFLAARSAVNGSQSIHWATVAQVAYQAAAMAVLAYAGHRMRGEPVAVPNLPADALIRAGRTLLAGGLVTVGTAVLQAEQAAVGVGAFDVGALAQTGATAAGMAALAWLHRVAADPLPMPSAVPPEPAFEVAEPPSNLAAHTEVVDPPAAAEETDGSDGSDGSDGWDGSDAPPADPAG